MYTAVGTGYVRGYGSLTWANRDFAASYAILDDDDDERVSQLTWRSYDEEEEFFFTDACSQGCKAPDAEGSNHPSLTSTLDCDMQKPTPQARHQTAPPPSIATNTGHRPDGFFSWVEPAQSAPFFQSMYVGTGFKRRVSLLSH